MGQSYRQTGQDISGPWAGHCVAAKNKVNSKTSDLIIYHNDVRGFSSNADSMNAIIKAGDASVVTLNETNMKGTKKPSIDGFFMYNLNRKKNLWEGYLLQWETCHSQFLIPINVVNYYGEQECWTQKKEIEDNWNAVLEDILTIESTGEGIIFIGDFNKHVGKLVPGIHGDKSIGGKLIEDLLETNKFTLVNRLDIWKEGPFKCYDPSYPFDAES